MTAGRSGVPIFLGVVPDVRFVVSRLPGVITSFPFVVLVFLGSQTVLSIALRRFLTVCQVFSGRLSRLRPPRAADASTRAELSRGSAAVRRLDAIVINHLGDDAVTRAVWERERRIGYPTRARRTRVTPARPQLALPLPFTPTQDGFYGGGSIVRRLAFAWRSSAARCSASDRASSGAALSR